MADNMKKLLTVASLLLLVGAFTPGYAQTNISVDINRAKLTWNWVSGTTPPDQDLPTEFRMKCGQATGNYTKVTPIPYPTKELAIKLAITGTGNWFCVVTAANQFGESGPSGEVAFAAGYAPANPTQEAIVVQ